MIYGSLCSGIEAATQAWHPLGWRPAFFSEIDAFPSAVLAHHYGSNLPGEAPSGNGVPNYGDMTNFQEWPDHAIDLLVGGTPCQSFSVAGLRKGLADPRGNLMLTFGAVAQKYQPRWLVWENVPGVLSSHGGRDFGTFLGMLAELGYGFAYRVLDAQYVRTRRFARAVPQRRRRVFVVGHLGDWRRAAAVLFDRESLSGHPAPRREAGKSAAKCLTRGACQRLDWETEDFIPEVAGTMKSCAQSGGFSNSADHAAAGYMVPIAFGAQNSPSQGEGFDASEDGTGRGTAIVPVAFDCKGTEVQYTIDGSHPTLRSMGHNHSHQNAGGHAAVAFDLNQITSKTNRSRPDPSVHHTLPATSCPPHLATPWAVRRLTPVECERLQGFPDDFTSIPYRGKPADRCPDGPRYKALGNSMAVNVMAWIGERIALVDAMDVEE